jgi:hypothetical protein
LGKWSYGSLIYNYLCNQCLSPLKLWVWIPLMQRCTRYNVMWYSLPVTCGRSVVFSGYSCFLYQWNWPPRCGWNIVWSGIKPHNHNTILDTVVRSINIFILLPSWSFLNIMIFSSMERMFFTRLRKKCLKIPYQDRTQVLKLEGA